MTLSLHPANPHYLQFRGKPTILITSGEHYGAVLNLDFDYRIYLDTLAADRLNNTRTWAGAYREVAGNFGIAENTLAPKPERFICPWPRTSTPGAKDGLGKFDLSKWDEAYFRRLRDFMSYADRRGVVVELNLFCPFYEDGMWDVNPMNAANNVNGIGAVPRTEVLTLKHPNLVAVHEAMTRRIVRELNRFDNLYYEICNEPYFGGVTLEWQARIAEIIAKEESRLPKRHIISWNVANNSSRVDRVIPHVSLLNFHYARPPVAVTENYHLNLPIGCNETGFDGAADVTYRQQAWDFLLAGGALFNNLDYSFTASHPNGTFIYPEKQPGGGTRALRRQYRHLRDFIHGFDFVRMKPADSVVTGGVPAGATARVLAETGRAYALYIKGANQASPVLSLPAGRYRAEWLNPVTGDVEKSLDIAHEGGGMTLASPRYRNDIALSVRRL